MEIDVTELVNDVEVSDFSSSVFESGLPNIGEVTYRNALQHVRTEGPLVESADQDSLRAWIRDFGAWDDDDIEAMSDDDTNALLLQFIAGDIREMDNYDDYAAYEKAAEDGQVGGSLYKGDDDRWYFDVGS